MNLFVVSPRFTRSIVAIAACVLTAGCEGNSFAPIGEAPLVDVLATTATAGSLIPVRLENPGSSAWNYNLCLDATLQRLVDDAWMPAPPPLRLCTLEMHTLPAGGSLESGVYVPLGYDAGTYRVAVEFSRNKLGSATALSGAFAVE
jgi:hypothetical protein